MKDILAESLRHVYQMMCLNSSKHISKPEGTNKYIQKTLISWCYIPKT